MNPQAIYLRYRELQAYVGWNEEDASRVQAIASLLDPFLPALIDDFYSEIEQHPNARKVITGGQAQIDRLKASLIRWLRELLAGPYDQDYVIRRWQVGWRHVEIGLDQIYTNVALSRLRTGLVGALGASWSGDQQRLVATIQSLNKLLDLDLAKIEDAYQSEHLSRQQRYERLAALGQIAGGVAHELRNPLNVVKTSAYFLLNARNPKPEKVAEHLQRIEQNVSVADSVITALSNFAKMPQPTLAPFSVVACVREALQTNPLPGSVQVELDFPAALPAALGDAAQIRIVFANLIRNARDAMPQGGRLTIRGEAVEGVIDIAFADTGVGIAAEHLIHVMEPLYSTKARGLGLGLALSRAILEKHGDTLRVTSEPQRGSTFVVRLVANPTKEEGLL
jgi:two-component system, NtrC family, sensor kinase